VEGAANEGASAPKGVLVFLTLEETGHYVMDDDLAIPPLEARGWKVEVIPWRQVVRDVTAGSESGGLPRVVVVRSTWDYHRAPGAFLDGMAALERAGIQVENGLPWLRWNLDKRYLRELEARGIPIVPTLWRDQGLEAGDLGEAAAHFGAPELVVKPVVGASAEDTLRIPVDRIGEMEPDALALFPGRPLQLQPFLPDVLTEGEYSLVYFDGRYSHTLLKTPAEGDFRVQEEYGSRLTTVDPGPHLRDAGERVMGSLPLPGIPLYARVDLVRHQGEWVLMELELIEPSLYLRMGPGAPERFAAAVDARFPGSSS